MLGLTALVSVLLLFGISRNCRQSRHLKVLEGVQLEAIEMVHIDSAMPKEIDDLHSKMGDSIGVR